MKLYVIFGQRECRYDGEYAPEAFECCDQFTMDENPNWIHERLDSFKSQSDIASAEIIEIDLRDEGMKKIQDRLNNVLTVDGTVVP